MRIHTRLTWSVVVLVLISESACHHPASKSAMGRESGVVVGDTQAFRPRVTDIDRGRHRVTFQLNEPAHLVLLSVVPGRTIEPLGAATGTGLTPPGKHVVSAMPMSASPAADPEPWSISQQADYDECVARGRASVPKKTVVRHDSTGREVTEQTAQPQDPSREYAIERRCASAVNNRPGKKAPEPTGRYLVLLASNAPMSFMEIVTRLREVTVYTDDMPAAMASITDALYVDGRAIWSGHYLRW